MNIFLEETGRGVAENILQKVSKQFVHQWILHGRQFICSSAVSNFHGCFCVLFDIRHLIFTEEPISDAAIFRKALLKNLRVNGVSEGIPIKSRGTIGICGTIKYRQTDMRAACIRWINFYDISINTGSASLEC